MSADGRIVNTNKAMLMEVRCHTCSRPVDRLAPWRGHEQCLEPDDSLYVSIDIDNYEER